MMDRQRLACDLFVACVRAGPGWETLLDERAAGDAELRSEVASLVEHHLRADGFLEPKSTAPGAGGAARAAVGSVTGLRAGKYRIIDTLGSGGMGIVYHAEQDRPTRTVALKLVRPGLMSGESMRRLVREAEVLALLEHPNIARLYEAGTIDADDGGPPQPYLAMELVRGRPLLKYAGDSALSIRDRVRLVALVCDAVEHAHRRGIIHRDLKPENILVDDTGNPKVLDFGVARFAGVDGTRHTLAGQVIGTLAYMSPEQLAGDAALTHRADIYALGVVLFELLSGRLPVETQGRSLPEVARVIAEGRPRRLAEIDRRLRGDLDVITAAALDHDPLRRYASAGDLGADLRRFLADEPIAARPPSAIYQLRKFAARNRVTVAAVSLVIGALATGLVIASVQTSRAREAQRQAVAFGHQARLELRSATIERGRLLGEHGDLCAAEDLLWPEFFRDPASPRTYWALWELYANGRCAFTIPLHRGDQLSNCLAVHPDGRTAALFDERATKPALQLIDLSTGARIERIEAPANYATCLTFGEEGRVLYASVGAGEIRRWRIGSHEELSPLEATGSPVLRVSMPPDRRRLAALSEDGSARIWTIDDKDQCTLVRAFPGGPQGGSAIALHPSDPIVVVGTGGRHVEVRNYETGARVQWIEAVWGEASMAFSPDGRLFAHGGRGSVIFIRDARTWELIRTLERASGTVRRLQFSPDGTRLLASRWDGWEIWNASSGALLDHFGIGRLGGYSEWAGNDRVLAHGLDETVRLWELEPRRWTARVKPDGPHPRAFALSPDRERVAVLHDNRSVSVWDLSSGRRYTRDGQLGPPARPVDRSEWKGRTPQESPVARPRPVTWTPRAAYLDAGRVAVLQADGLVDLCDGRTGARLATLDGALAEGRQLAVSRTGATLAAAGTDRIAVWDLGGYAGGPGERAPEPRAVVHARAARIALSPDGGLLCTRGAGRVLSFYDTRTGNKLPGIEVANTSVTHSLTFSPDGAMVAVGAWQPEIQVVDVPGGRRLPSLMGHSQVTRDLKWAEVDQGSSLLASVSSDGTLRLWDPTQREGGANLVTIHSPDVLSSIEFSRDGDAVVVGDGDGAITAWSLRAFDRHIAGNMEYQLSRLPPEAGAQVDRSKLVRWLPESVVVPPLGGRTGEQSPASGGRPDPGEGD